MMDRPFRMSRLTSIGREPEEHQPAELALIARFIRRSTTAMDGFKMGGEKA